MGTFSASLRAIGDVKALTATIELSDGHLSIIAGSTEIGKWPLSEISLEEIPTGYRMSAEGEQIILEVKDLDSFAAELNAGKKKRLFSGRNKKEKGKEAASSFENDEPERVATVQTARPPSPPAERADTKPAAPAKKSKTGTNPAAKVLDLVDSLLIKAKKRYGAVLPDFMFSRAMFLITLAAFVTMVLLPSVFSMLFVIVGALVVLFGAVVYSDSVLASRFLPGRATPQQALLLGLGILVFGVVLGIVAK